MPLRASCPTCQCCRAVTAVDSVGGVAKVRSLLAASWGSLLVNLRTKMVMHSSIWNATTATRRWSTPCYQLEPRSTC